MVDAGILHEDEPLELLGGELVVVSPQGPRHRYLVTLLRERLVRAYAGSAWVQEDKPLAVSPHDLPEPDVAVIEGEPRDYRAHHPTGSDARLVVEVIVTSHERDRRKLPLYARGGVPEVWLLDAEAERAEVHSGPRPDGRFAQTRTLGPGDGIRPPGTDVEWRVRELFSS